ncbi:hypothetical protein BGZ88_000826 [Linnemannia elongata]|nr:hypothetical protein BGZ88_000826 [Linnemannia elongata]
MDTNRKDDYNTEAEPLLDLYDIHHAPSSSPHDQQQTLPPGYYVDMTDIDSTTKDAHYSTSPAAVVAPVHPQCTCQQQCPCQQWHSSRVSVSKGPWELVNERFGNPFGSTIVSTTA